MNTNITSDELVEIVKLLTPRYGPDIAHDVAVAILGRQDREPIRDLKNWALSYGYGRMRREQTIQGLVKNFSDLNLAGKSLLMEALGLGVLGLNEENS